jgi:murein DD-endopeptidase MepM/ murein hydrolase activator NlpD
MSIDSNRRRKEKDRYTVLFVPNNKSENQKSFVVSRLSLALIIVGIVVFISVVVLGFLIYTPIANYLPMSNPELENRYGKQIVSIQQKLNSLLEEIVVLRQYNVQLRKALGEKMPENDSAKTSDQEKFAKQKSMKNNYRVEDESTTTKPLFAEEQFDYQSAIKSAVGFPIRKTFESEVSGFDLPFTKPVDGFAARTYSAESGHLGLDISGKEGSPILAAAPGTVIFSDWLYDYGFTIIVAHENGFLTVYKHNQTLLKKEGDNVKRGEPIALLGNTGKKSTGPHLHFEIWKNSYSVDPDEYLLNSK